MSYIRLVSPKSISSGVSQIAQSSHSNTLLAFIAGSIDGRTKEFSRQDVRGDREALIIALSNPSGWLLITEDLVNFTLMNPLSSSGGSAVISAGGVSIAGLSTSHIRRSTNLQDWESHISTLSAHPSGQVSRFGYGAETFVALSSGNGSFARAARSIDGTNWVAASFPSVSSNLSATVNGIAYGHQGFLALVSRMNPDTLASAGLRTTSVDGVSWSGYSTIPGLGTFGGTNAVGYGNGMYISSVIGSSHELRYGDITLPNIITGMPPLYCFEFAAGVWVAGSNGGNIIRSDNNWGSYTTINVAGVQTIRSVRRFKDRFVACSSNGKVLASDSQGLNWEVIDQSVTNGNLAQMAVHTF